MDEHKELREMIANGKDRLEWTRKVDQGQVVHDHDFDGDGGGGEDKQKPLWTCIVNWDNSSQMIMDHLRLIYLVFLCSSPAFESSFILRWASCARSCKETTTRWSSAASSADWTSLFYLFFTFFIKVKLGGLVSQLYKLAFQTYHDIPRGPIKVENSARWYWCWWWWWWQTQWRCWPCWWWGGQLGWWRPIEIWDTRKELSSRLFTTCVGLVPFCPL